MITFKNIKYKNFLSTGNTPIEIKLNSSNTTLIVGTNGSGKSTLLDALCFVLFNRPFRIIKKEQMVNTVNDGDCLIELEFDVGTKKYLIKRGIKPNLFEIYQDGVLVNQDANSIDYQKYLENNIMRLNYRSFLQVVLLGSSSYEPFMKMKPRYRREVVEEILDIRVFGLMDLILRPQQSELTRNITDLSHKCDLIESKYETELKHYNAISDLNMNDLDGKKRLLEKNGQDNYDYNRKIDKINDELERDRDSLKDQTKEQVKMTKLSKLEAKIEQNLSTHEKTLEFFNENDNCPTCTQPIDDQFRQDKQSNLKEKVTSLNEGMKKIVEEIAKQEEHLLAMDKISKKVYEMNVEVSKLQTSVEELNKYSNNIHEEIQSLENKQSDGKDIEKQLENLKLDLEENKIKRDKIVDQQKYVDVLRNILNDKGAKSQIIKKYVPIMNTLINQYLQSMDFFISFHLDEEFNETVKSRFRDTFNYNNFSEGEKMRIDLALLFTWRHIAKMKNSVNTNLLVLDEIFDSSLDGQGTDDFFKIIKTMTKENIFIISHKGDILFDKFTDIVKFEKYKNFTRLNQA
jgi:DNA repair exonuclease SbcCD ATPase subunit|tara:strand:+ start:2578 stop:4293 length:1716 start_codon:yes stop_codon:yes gene_type:complete